MGIRQRPIGLFSLIASNAGSRTADLPKLSKPIAEMTPLELENYRRYLQHEIQSMAEQLKEIERQVAARAASGQK